MCLCTSEGYGRIKLVTVRSMGLEDGAKEVLILISFFCGIFLGSRDY